MLYTDSNSFASSIDVHEMLNYTESNDIQHEVTNLEVGWNICNIQGSTYGMVHLPEDAPVPRLCTINKTSPDQEYGYNLHAEKGRNQYVGMVDRGSPADKGGLRMGDRIFAVNGHVIQGEGHKKVVERIKQNPLQCEMLVITEEGAKWYAEHGIPINLDLPNIQRVGQLNGHLRSSDVNGSPPPAAGWYAPSAPASQQKQTVYTRRTPTSSVSQPVFVAPPPPKEDPNMSQPLPKLCKLEKVKQDDEFGFNLHAEKNRGHFIGTVDAGGIGDRAGLRMGQRIVGVNGLLVYPNTPHKEVVALIKKSPLSTTLLVAPEDVDKWYRDQGVSYSFELAEEGAAVHPHTIHIEDEEIHPDEPLHKTAEIVPEPLHEPEVHHYENHHHEEPQHVPSYNAYEETPVEVHQDDLLSAVFGGIPPLEVLPLAKEAAPQAYDIVPGDEEDDEPYWHDEAHHQHDDSREPSIHESAVDVPHYVPTYAPEPLHHHNKQISPVSNGSSSNGYERSNQSSPMDHNDIFALSAKDARERLRQNKKNIHRGFDMSLEEKYRLVTNM